MESAFIFKNLFKELLQLVKTEWLVQSAAHARSNHLFIELSAFLRRATVYLGRCDLGQRVMSDNFLRHFCA